MKKNSAPFFQDNSRREFIFSTIKMVAGAASFGIVGELSVICKSDYDELKDRLSKMGIQYFDLAHFASKYAKGSWGCGKFNMTYGRMGNFALEDAPAPEQIHIITKGPRGRHLKESRKDLTIVASFSEDLLKVPYLTDASPHYWNNAHKNNRGIYKSYFIDQTTRSTVDLVLNCYDKQMKLEQFLSLEDIFKRIQEDYAKAEVKALNSLKEKYQVGNFEDLINRRINSALG